MLSSPPIRRKNFAKRTKIEMKTLYLKAEDPKTPEIAAKLDAKRKSDAEKVLQKDTDIAANL